VISYFDSIFYPGAHPEFGQDSHALSLKLANVSDRFGDRTHQSGSADYLVRFWSNPETLDVREQVANYFLVVGRADTIEIIEKVGDEDPICSATLPYADGWRDNVANKFEQFRQRLDLEES
jgi:hypothetical protein